MNKDTKHSKKLRIGHYMPHYGTNTGTGQVLKKLCMALKGHEYLELFVFKSGSKFEVIKEDNLTFITYPTKGLKSIPNLKFLKAIIKNHYELDVLSIHKPFTISNLLAYIFSAIPLDYYPHGCINPKGINQKGKKLKKKLYIKYFEKKIMLKARKVVCVTKKEEAYAKKMGLKNTTVAYFPFQLPKLKFKSSKFREDRNFSNTDFLIGFIGRYDIYTKGLDLLIPAIRKANKKIPEVKCILIGYDSKMGAIDNLIINENSSNCVFNLGTMYGEEKFEALLACDLYIQPSRFDSFGVSIFEAMSLEIPCLLSEGCDITESIYESNGCFKYNGTTNSLSESIATIASMGEERKKIAKNGYNWVVENLSKNALIENWEKVYLS